MTTDPTGSPSAGTGHADEPLLLLARVLADEPDGSSRVAFVRDLAHGDPADPAFDVLATWFGRARKD